MGVTCVERDDLRTGDLIRQNKLEANAGSESAQLRGARSRPDVSSYSLAHFSDSKIR